MSYLSHLLVVVMSEVQFVSGPSLLRLPSVDIIWICKIGEVCITVTKHNAKVKQLNQHKNIVVSSWPPVPGSVQPNTSALRQMSPCVPFSYQVCGLIRM